MSCLPNLLNRKRRQNVSDQQIKDQVPASKSDAVSTQSSSTVATEEDHSIKGGRLMGSAVKTLLKHFDSAALGVKIVLGETRVEACYGRISIDGLTIENPEGFNSEYLLKASKLMIDLDMQKLLTSWGKTLEVEKVVLEHVDVIYERSWSTSNVDTVNQKLNSRSMLASSTASTASMASRTQNQPEKVVVHKVLLSNIGAKACTTLGSMGPRLAVGDIKYEDFNAEMGAQTVVDGISLVLETLLKSIVASLLGKETCKSAWDVLAHGKSRVRLAASQLCQQISDLGSACSSCRCQRGEELVLDELDEQRHFAV